MNVVLIHPIHGAKIAIHQQEMETDVKNGWTVYNPATPAEQPSAVEPEPEVEKPKRKYTRKVTEQPIEQPNEAPEFLASVSDESDKE